MTERALGLIETRGLVAAIEAADAMVKAARVVCVGKELTDAALITIKIVGEVGAVKSALEAGSKAAAKVGELVATHIIPNPHLETELILYSPAERLKLDDGTRKDGESANPGNVDSSAIDHLPIAELRKLASLTQDFPLSPDQISHAPKAQLLQALRRKKSAKPPQ